jgi:glycosyltransferase involved in cell wall biosynthesis
MGYLCKYLAKEGWQPSVITEETPLRLFTFLKGDTEVRYIRFRRYYDGLGAKVERLWMIIAELLFGFKERRVYREAMEIAQSRRFDVVLCSTFRVFPLPAAQRLAQRLKLPLIADIRDIIEQCADNEFIDVKIPRLLGVEKLLVAVYRGLLLKRRNKALSAAQCITTVSPWHVKILKQFNTNVELIYNGFDPELFFPAPVADFRFCITYTGRIFNIALRNPALLFEAVAKLDKERVIDTQTFYVQWFTDEESRVLIEKTATEHGVTDYMEYYGYAPAVEIPAILNRSAILLILTNKSGEGGPNGIMTTKFFEAIAVERPILCVRGDEGCLEDVINSTRAGLSAHNSEEVYNYIKKLYNQWLQTGFTTVNSNRNEIERFSRKSQSLQFIEIFEKVISKQ